jgi:hypothetical protein
MQKAQWGMICTQKEGQPTKEKDEINTRSRVSKSEYNYISFELNSKIHYY